jgi:hypothetical protein
MMALYARLMSCQWSVMISNELFFQFPDAAKVVFLLLTGYGGF